MFGRWVSPSLNGALGRRKLASRLRSLLLSRFRIMRNETHNQVCIFGCLLWEGRVMTGDQVGCSHIPIVRVIWPQMCLRESSAAAVMMEKPPPSIDRAFLCSYHANPLYALPWANGEAGLMTDNEKSLGSRNVRHSCGWLVRDGGQRSR